MSITNNDQYRKEIILDGVNYSCYDINTAAADCGFNILDLPYSLRVLFENVIRGGGDKNQLDAFRNWLINRTSLAEIEYRPSRVLMQDFTGVPAIVDLASMRNAMQKIGKDPKKINPLIPVDLVIDHSVQVDISGTDSAFASNVAKEFERNKERYQFLKWGQKSFSNFRVVPPDTGICHQVNLEYLAQVVWSGKAGKSDKAGKQTLIYPDSLVGTDSHTTMVNALAVLGWGVGGIEAEAAMLGQPLPMILPEVVGFKLTGSLQGTVNATDLVLTITHILRKQGVVGKFVEFFGPGLHNLSLANRATIANMAPEYGATCGFFPIDEETIRYLNFTGRNRHWIEVVQQYAKNQNLWYGASDGNKEAKYSQVIELDISTIEPSVAGPKRPQDLISLKKVKNNFNDALASLAASSSVNMAPYPVPRKGYNITHGQIVIAALTSCTNTSNPSVMIAAGLLAKKARQLGLTVKPWVKTSLAPGSQVVTAYLNKGGLSRYLDELGFNLVGYGCTTCIGNSGPLDSDIEQVINDNKLVVVSVLSGNRNFEGRIHPNIRANYLASPPLVIAYALAGTINVDLTSEPVSYDAKKNPVYLKDIWPSEAEIQEYTEKFITPIMFTKSYDTVFRGDINWQNLKVQESATYKWDPGSSYINNPPYFTGIDQETTALNDIKEARILAIFGDSITTDHISPAGAISPTSPAGKFLLNKGISAPDFNSYGSRRGNHEVMIRGTFANPRIKNILCPGTEGGITVNHFTSQQMSIYDAAMDYKARGVDLVIFAGKEYGTGSSRDWAAKGTSLLGVRAIIAKNFERIHRSNLIGMGVLPLVFAKEDQQLELAGNERITIAGLSTIKPYQALSCIIEGENRKQIIEVTLQAYTESEIEYIKHGNILAMVVKNI